MLYKFLHVFKGFAVKLISVKG